MDPSHEMYEREYFRKNYADYDLQNPPRKMRFYRALVERCAGGIERPRVLELGCAFGKFLSTLNPEWDRSGLDLSKFAVESARDSVPGVNFSVSSITDIPFEGRFDVIAAFDVIEHVSDLEQVACSVKSKLSSSGYFVFVVPTYDGPTGPLIRLLDKDVTHLHKVSRQFWLDWARRHFEVVEWRGIFRILLPWGYYLHIPTKTLRSMSPAIAVVARKGPSH